MLADFREASDRLRNYEYDVCICGTGPAGITLARRLAAAGRTVVLLEGGGLEYSDESQDLYKGRNVGRTYWDIELGRLRFFGGTSNHWSGRCGLFDEIDFEQRGYFGLPGWPIDRSSVLRYLKEAQEVLDIAGSDLEAKQQLSAGSLFFTSAYALSPPTRFAEKYRSEIEQSKRLECFYNANLVKLELNEDRSHVEAFAAAAEPGALTTVRAKRFVLALGAIENPRALLNSGLDRGNTMIGRCFMEHLNVSVGRFVVTDPSYWLKRSLQIVPSHSFMKDQNVGNGILHFESNAQPKSYGRLRVLKQFLRETACRLPDLADVTRQIVDFDCPGDGLITTLIEQIPNVDSRVSLTDDVDRFGLRRIQLNWRLEERDLRTIRILSIEAAKEVARTNRARVQLSEPILNRDLPIEVGSHAHQMGTTRMATSARDGVVDVNCRFHGVDNLFVAGSSVFPTGGGTNPTLTIVMLAIRLAEHLSSLE